MTGADALLEAKIDEATALRRERARLVDLLRALLRDPTDVTARERARDVVGA